MTTIHVETTIYTTKTEEYNESLNDRDHRDHIL